ncbi:MAG TPA: serine/threonine-protein kinase, partial [Isosphaeraceae bacterium]
MTQGTDEPTRDDGTKDPFRSPPAYVPIETASDAGPRPEGGLLDGPGLDGPIVPGQVLFGRFKVLRKIADGGMGQVWLVRHRELDSERALKLIPPLCAIDESARMRFGREARTLARLAHPNIVVVHDAQLSGHTVFIEMEFVRGQGLDTRMGRGVPMPLDGIGRILMQLCAALQAAHDQHIVHRDLKPSNLMLVDGRPPGEELLKVLDFGIAKILSAETQGPDGRPLTEGFIGTVPYASPEQVLDRPVDGRGDIYSTGVILYEMLTGSRPFAGTLLEQMHAHAYQPPPPMGLKNPRTHVPLEVEKVVMRCLAKDPAGRPQSPRELAEEFRRAVDLDPSPPRRRWPAFMAMAGVLALLVGLVVASRPRPPRLTAGPSASPPASFPPADVTNEDRRSREGIGAEYVLG